MDSSVPVIDLASPREQMLKQLRHACQVGFFQIVHHGTPPDVLEKLSRLSKAFFAFPSEFKRSCTTEKGVAGPIYFGASHIDSRDMLKLTVSPESSVVRDNCPTHPLGYDEALREYVSQLEQLAKPILGLVSESLGLDSDYILNECSVPRPVLVMNDYPPCDDPESYFGIKEHSDPGTITIVLQDSVAGLQVLKWLDVEPMEEALVNFIGVHLQTLGSNKYSSCWHKVIPDRKVL